MASTILKVLAIFATASAMASANPPKKYQAEEGGFQPSHLRYYESDLPGKSANKNKGSRFNASSKIDLDLGKESKEGDRLRFGIPLTTTYGNTGVGGSGSYGNGVGYVMTPMKIDLGGIALGALIGLGAVLIVPKLAHIFGGGLGYRSVENDISPLTDALAKIDRSLEQHNIDSSSCMQRVICTYVNDAQRSTQTGDANTLDQMIYSLINNKFFTAMLDGSTVKQAVDLGKQPDEDSCSSLYQKCPINKDNVLQIVDSLLPA